MFKNVKRWTYGLMAGFVGGGAGAASTAITGLVLAPNVFNFADAHGVAMVLKSMVGSFLIMGALNAFSYLSKAPLPDMSNGNGDTGVFKKME